MRRLLLASLVAAAALIATHASNASPAEASVTIGQLAPGNPPPVECTGAVIDRVQPTVASGNTYVVPGAGTITSWSHNAAAGMDQTLTMKVFRKVADPASYMVVGHDGPRPLAPGTLNSFPVSIAVNAGDVLGLNQDSPANTACIFSGGPSLSRFGNLADGQWEAFITSVPFSLNVSAVIEPDADHDGFGDETQDQCPTNATTQGPCPTIAPPTTAPASTGQRAAAIKKCKKKFPGKAKAKKRKKCIKKAKKLPV